MEIQQLIRTMELKSVGEDVLGFDLEMANSFRRQLPVICMIGLEHYEADNHRCVTTLATITRREEEPQLVRWFLEFLRNFRDRHGKLRLVTFSGEENDLPWMEERISRYGIEASERAILDELESVDLRIEFFKRTQTNRISLKKLEEEFGIIRESEMSSRKVSQVLTNVLTEDHRQDEIPQEIYDYLVEDVHHMLCILNDWDKQKLDSHFLPEFEYLNRVTSLMRLCRRVLDSPRVRLKGGEGEALAAFLGDLGAGLEGAVAAQSFAQFALPGLPPLEASHPEVERLSRRFDSVRRIELGGQNGTPYRLMAQLGQPKGTLAVVQRGGQVLMIRRADHLKRAPGMWGLPGGVMEQGETPGAGAARELLEEVNLRGRPRHVLGTTPSVTGHYELFWVAMDVEDYSTLKPDAAEVAETRWVGPEDLPGLHPLIPGAEDGFRQFLGQGWGAAHRHR